MLRLTIRLLTQIFLGTIFLVGLLFTTILIQIGIDPTIVKGSDVATATPDEIRMFIATVLLGCLILITASRIAIYLIFEMSPPKKANKSTSEAELS